MMSGPGQKVSPPLPDTIRRQLARRYASLKRCLSLADTLVAGGLLRLFILSDMVEVETAG
jgi:hypothetical protein